MTLFGATLARLLESVGNNRSNREDDVANVRRNLTRLNYRSDEDKAEDIFTKPLHHAIQTFQANEGLEKDGWLRPGGPTEERLKTRVARQSFPFGGVLPNHAAATQSFPTSGIFTKTILKGLYDSDTAKSIKDDEDTLPKLYLDTKGKPTVGVGFMIPTVDEAKTYPFYKWKDGKPTKERAGPEEVERAFWTVKKQPFGQNHTAISYQDLTNIGLRQEDIDQRLQQKLHASVDELRGKFPDFEKAPHDVQLGLLDMQFNLGNAKFQRHYEDPVSKTVKGWPALFKAYDNKDWKKMAQESHRKDVPEGRNEKVFNLLFNAK